MNNATLKSKSKRICIAALLLIGALALAACGATNEGATNGSAAGGDSQAAASGNGAATSGAAGEDEAGSEANSADAAAADAEAGQWPRTIEHAMGELVLEERPERVASVDIMGTDYLLALGFAPVVSEGFSTKARSPIFAEYAEGMDVVDLGGKTNLETLLEMDPQVIVMTSSGKGARFEEFDKLAPSVVIDFSLSAPDRLRKFAEVIGAEAKAEEVIADFEALKAEAVEAAKGHADETVLFLVSNGKDFTVVHPANFPIYYGEVGLKPVEGLPEDGKIGGRIGIEALSEFAPDHIFIAENRRQMNPDDPQGLINIWTDNPVWNNLKAVQSGQVYSVDTLVGDTFFLGQVAGLQAIVEHLGS
ncbi:ABC transporter substrate-binding protein [Paenibacillus sp. IB182496]|uniref:ABC transporter substrate-binding protein n=1 Tax=Paenibacillus sabuli TaxID=2772509 RepID=A0A927GQU2_9BACL|nr:ABC transporter substrate-binding protein [Paenibacillus sabuli]MBD2844127.1 ABC transporter substrate-binding protein [Paenibacillus sabuli]